MLARIYDFRWNNGEGMKRIGIKEKISSSLTANGLDKSSDKSDILEITLSHYYLLIYSIFLHNHLFEGKMTLSS